MQIRPWKVGIVILAVGIGALAIQIDHSKTSFIDGGISLYVMLLPVSLLVIFTIIMEKVKGPGWEDKLKSERQFAKEKHGMFGEDSPFAPLRGHPSMIALGIGGILGAMGLFALGNYTQVPIYWLGGLFFMVVGSSGLALAGLPKVEQKTSVLATKPTAEGIVHENEGSPINPHGKSTYQGKPTGNKMKTAIVAFILMAVPTVAFTAVEMGVFEDGLFSVTDLRGSSSSTAYQWTVIDSHQEQFPVTGTPSQNGASSFIAIPTDATQWNLTVTWNRFLTDTQDQSLVIQERINGEWTIVETGTHGGRFDGWFEANGDAFQVILSAQASAQNRQVTVEVDFAQQLATKCSAKEGDAPTCKTSARED